LNEWVRDILSKCSRFEITLVVLFVFSLPLANPWVRGDGVGYYAYARALLIEHRLDFTKDWQHGNESFAMGRIEPDGMVNPKEFTRTGHIYNHWTIGPSLLWLPFLLIVHLDTAGLNLLGAHIARDGFSRPYLMAMALSTALYGFLGLYISFCLAREYFNERWAFLATIGIWFASSLPVYMYFNPSWSHAHSAFVNSLFLWYWHRSRDNRSWKQWTALGLISGLAVDVYYPNGILLIIPLLEAVVGYANLLRSKERIKEAANLFAKHVLYLATFLLGLLPTLVSRNVVFGSPISTGYPTAEGWSWQSPAFLRVLLSTDHGVFTWTPILILAILGLLVFVKVDRTFAIYLLAAVFVFYAVISFYPNWDGLSSFGNRFFVSLTPIFVLGLAAFFDWLARAWRESAAFRASSVAIAILIAWNLGMIFQWGMHLIPVRGPISFREAAYNQVAVVPEEVIRKLKNYFTHRGQMMNQIEEQDMKQLKSRSDSAPD
jgi:hypothetical protein